MRLLAAVTLWAAALAAQQGPTPTQLARMTLSIAEVRIGADEHGRSELCSRLREMREQGVPVVPAANGGELGVECAGRPAAVLVLRLSEDLADPRRALCEYAAAPAGLVFERVDWMLLRRGGPPVSGEQMRSRLEPLGVRTLASLMFAFGFERIEVRAGAETLFEAPLHQIDGFCAA